MRYDNAAQKFSFRWRLGTSGTGRVTGEVRLYYYTSVISLSRQITVDRNNHR